MARRQVEYTFGPFRLIPGFQLMQGQRQLGLGGRTLDILHLLVMHAGDLVSKEALIDFAWPNQSVSDSNLRVHIRKIRRVLGEVRGQPTYITSVARRGYRFVAPVSVVSDGDRRPALSDKPSAYALPPRQHLIGRETEFASVCGDLDHCELVTLVGTAGVGKTTLAVAAAHIKGAGFADGVCFVDLSATSDLSLVAHLVATALGLRGRPTDITTSVVSHLRRRQILLVLDNCEHVLPAVAMLAERVLGSSSGARVLTTSREALAIEGEMVRRIEPLAGPAGALPIRLEDALAYPSVRFFVSRANESGYKFKDADVSMIVRLCWALDGLPLALELAVVKLRQLTVGELLASIDQRFNVLRADDEASRHGTLWKTLDWSHRLLSVAVARLFLLLSTFAGTFELPDIVAMARLAGLDPYQTTTCFSDLVAKSLVVADIESGAIRYRLLESVRDYGAQRLSQDGGLWREAQSGHAGRVLDIFENAEREWRSTDVSSWRSRYERRIGDLRKALDWSFGGGSPAVGLRLACAAIRLWNEQSTIFEQMFQVERALQSGLTLPDSAREMARLAISRAWSLTLARQLGPETDHAWRDAMDFAERSADSVLQQTAVSSSAIFLIYTGRNDMAVNRLEACVSAAARQGDTASLIDGERRSALAEMHLGLLARARDKLERLALSLDHGMPPSRITRYKEERYVSIHSTLAFLTWLMGQPDDAWAMSERMVERTGAGRHLMGQSNVLGLVALPIAFWRGDISAVGGAVQALRRNLEVENIAIWEPVCRFYDATVAHARGDDDALPGMIGAIGDLLRDRFLVRTPMYLGIAAEAALARGSGSEASQWIDHGLAQQRECKEFWCLPELLRIKAKVLATSLDCDRARGLLIEARSTARDMGARSLQLRIETDLACLPQSDQDGAQSMRALSATFRSFEQGHGTSDLARAAMLLKDPIENQ